MGSQGGAPTNGARDPQVAAQRLDAVRIGDREQAVEVPASVWHEVELPLATDLTPGRTPVSIQSGGESFTSLHYFSLGAPN